MRSSITPNVHTLRLIIMHGEIPLWPLKINYNHMKKLMFLFAVFSSHFRPDSAMVFEQNHFTHCQMQNARYEKWSAQIRLSQTLDVIKKQNTITSLSNSLAWAKWCRRWIVNSLDLKWNEGFKDAIQVKYDCWNCPRHQLIPSLKAIQIGGWRSVPFSSLLKNIPHRLKPRKH